VVLVRFVRFIACAGLLTGCFYVDPINQRPRIMSVERQCDQLSTQACDVDFKELHRGDAIKLKASFRDPDGDTKECTYGWRVLACNNDGSLCDDSPLYEGTDAVPALQVRKLLDTTGEPVQRIRVELDLRDNRGALDSVFPEFPVNDGPTLALRGASRNYTVGAPISMFAVYSDPDDRAADVGLTWTVFSPDGQPAYTLADLAVTQDPHDPVHLMAGKTLVPAETGTWDVRVNATDPHGKATEKHLVLPVVADRSPCLAQWQPIAPPDGMTLPISAPTLFQIPLVDDDLDPYPAVSGEPLLGTTTFAWSILPPGASARQPLVGATGNTVALDPGAFTPGDLVELRVEISDRNHLPVTCADGDAICSVSAPAGCLQRQTWRVEIR
jgi:hypothetical protein